MAQLKMRKVEILHFLLLWLF